MKISLLDRILPLRSIPVRDLGPMGEARAAWYYRVRGFEILARNVRTARGEVDLVVRRRRVIAFVEIKTRQQSVMGPPHEAVDRRKQLRIAAVAERFLVERGFSDLEARFDVLSLLWNGRRFVIEHFPHAFTLEADPRAPWKVR